jgi:nucleoside-diphosphate-sugar epimerase
MDGTMIDQLRTLSGSTALVTGATGSLGGALALTLADRGVSVRALTRSAGRGRFLRQRGDVDVVEGDVTDAARMREVSQGCDYVFHAAVVQGTDLGELRRVIREGTRNLVEAAAMAGTHRFVHISTVLVYGYRQTADVSENTPLTPGRDAYSIAKAEAEEVVRSMGDAEGLSWTILRPGGIYGPRSRAWTARMFRRARRRPVVMPGTGRGSFPGIYVDDLIDQCMVAAVHPSADREAFNSVMDPAPTVREYMGALSSLAGHRSWLGIPIPLMLAVLYPISLVASRNSRWKDGPDIVRFLDRYHNYSMAKSRDLLGWQPRIGLEEGIRRCVPWLREKGLLE